MFGGLNVLGFVYNYRKAIMTLFVVGGLWGVGSLGKSYYYSWHIEPLEMATKRVTVLSAELNNTKELLEECRNKKRVEAFSSTNRTVFDAYRRELEEMENEKKELNVSSHFDNYEWMYH